jgi:hypothetical protein
MRKYYRADLRPTQRAPDRLRRGYAYGYFPAKESFLQMTHPLLSAAGTPYGKTTLRGRKQTQTVGRLSVEAGEPIDEMPK